MRPISRSTRLLQLLNKEKLGHFNLPGKAVGGGAPRLAC